jgi:selenocysteine-specific elongation factor
MPFVILGTAGHVDHGKSAIIKTLTGTDPDRLKEEKERGITIDLGFANLEYSDGLTVGIVDVPGHEKLVRNMLAGAGGIDIVLFVVAADEGIMPQTKEHLAICNLLKIKAGLIAITKTDLVEEEQVQLLSEKIKQYVKGTFLENAEIIPVSSKTGKNIELLREKIKEIGLKTPRKIAEGIFRLPIDRVFTLKGFGTVVTGTAISGEISVDEAVEILPAVIRSKARGLHSHGKSISKASAGQRVAINLTGIEKENLKRGDVVVLPGRFQPTKILDAKIELLKNAPILKNKGLVHFHSGTSEVIARVILYDRNELKAGEGCYCQLRLMEPIVAMSGDRYIIRRFSPVDTIGGGEILDPSPKKRKKLDGLDDLKIFDKGTLDEKIEMKVTKSHIKGIPVSSIEGWINIDVSSINESIKTFISKGIIARFEDILLHKSVINELKDKINKILTEFHKLNPLKSGFSKEEVRSVLKIDHKIFNAFINSISDIVIDKDIIRLPDFKISLSDADEIMKKQIVMLLEQNHFQPPLKDDLITNLSIPRKQLEDILKILLKEGIIIRINDSLYLTAVNYKKMIEFLKCFFAEKKEMSVSEFRDMIGTSRKYAVPYLEHLDAVKVTIRTGDVRKSLLK